MTAPLLTKSNMPTLFKTVPNRVRRSYLGGAMLDVLQGTYPVTDGYCPEAWIGSTVEAKNPGLAPMDGEGLTTVRDPWGKPQSLRDLIAARPEAILGKVHLERFGSELGFLAKWLDSAVRLPMQVHPTTAFAQSRMGQPFGKFEAYYVLSCRRDVEPYLLLGFQHPPSRVAWKHIIESQDLSAMQACFERIPVKPGDVWMVPGGIPHAIGEGMLVLELMEASDLVVRCEFDREGMTVPPEGRYMGRDLEFCLDVFDYQAYAAEAVAARFKLRPEYIAHGAYGWVEQWIGPDQTDAFQGFRIRQTGPLRFGFEDRLCLWVQTRGTCELTHEGQVVRLKQGESAWIAASVAHVDCKCEWNNSEAIWVVPGDWETGLTLECRSSAFSKIQR